MLLPRLSFFQKVFSSSAVITSAFSSFIPWPLSAVSFITHTRTACQFWILVHLYMLSGHCSDAGLVLSPLRSFIHSNNALSHMGGGGWHVLNISQVVERTRRKTDVPILLPCFSTYPVYNLKIHGNRMVMRTSEARSQAILVKIWA